MWCSDVGVGDGWSDGGGGNDRSYSGGGGGGNCMIFII
jgi:hypothetical protein